MKVFAPTFDVYLSGPISSYGKLKANLKMFADAAAALRARGLRVFSPPEGEPLGGQWADYLRRDIRYLVDCSMVVLLPGWHKSRGARLEKRIADALGMQVVTLKEMLDDGRESEDVDTERPRLRAVSTAQ